MINRRVARQSISYLGSQTLAYTECLNFILQSEQFGEDFVLPGRVQALLVKLSKAFVVREDCELAMLEVGTPLLDCDNNHHVFLFISGETTGLRAQSLAEECNWVPMLHQYSSNTDCTGVRFHCEGRSKIW